MPATLYMVHGHYRASALPLMSCTLQVTHSGQLLIIDAAGTMPDVNLRALACRLYDVAVLGVDLAGRKQASHVIIMLR